MYKMENTHISIVEQRVCVQLGPTYESLNCLYVHKENKTRRIRLYRSYDKISNICMRAKYKKKARNRLNWGVVMASNVLNMMCTIFVWAFFCPYHPRYVVEGNPYTLHNPPSGTYNYRSQKAGSAFSSLVGVRVKQNLHINFIKNLHY